jgi:hypothetical protein
LLISTFPSANQAEVNVVRNKLVALIATALAFGGASAAFAESGSDSPRLSVTMKAISQSSDEALDLSAAVQPGAIWRFHIQYICAVQFGTCDDSNFTISLPPQLEVYEPPKLAGGQPAPANKDNKFSISIPGSLSKGELGDIHAVVALRQCVKQVDKYYNELTTGGLATAKTKSTSSRGGTESVVSLKLAPVPRCLPEVCVEPNCVDDGAGGRAVGHRKTGGRVAPGAKGQWDLVLKNRKVGYSVSDKLPTGSHVTMLWNNEIFGAVVTITCGSKTYDIPFGKSIYDINAPACQSSPLDGFPLVSAVKVTVPADADDGRVSIQVSIPENAKPGIISNTAASSTGESFQGYMEIVPNVLAVEAKVAVVGAQQQIQSNSTLWGQTKTVLARSALQPDEIVWSAAVRDGQISGIDMENPVIRIELNKNHTFASSSWQYAHALAQSGTIKLPEACENPTFTPSARVLMWSFPGCKIPRHQWGYVGVAFSTKLEPGLLGSSAATATMLVGFTASPAETMNACSIWPLDGDDMDKDGLTTDRLCGAPVSQYLTPDSAKLTPTMTIKTETPTPDGVTVSNVTYPQYASVRIGESDLGRRAYPSVQYNLAVANTGTTPLRTIDLLDVLPHTGASPTDDTIRDSTVDVRLLSIDSVSIKRGTTVTNAAAETKIRYSTSTNPCRFIEPVNQANFDSTELKLLGDVFSSATDPKKFHPAGCSIAWIDPAAVSLKSDPVRGWAPRAKQAAPGDIRSWALRYQPASPMMPGDTLIVVLQAAVIDTMVGGVSTPPPGGTTAWNSVAFTGTRTDVSGNILPVPTYRPILGGVRLLDDTTFTFGGDVWYDNNDNGVRDPEELAMTPSDYVVELYDAAGVKVAFFDPVNPATSTIENYEEFDDGTFSFVGKGLNINGTYTIVFAGPGINVEGGPEPSTAANNPNDLVTPNNRALYDAVRFRSYITLNGLSRQYILDTLNLGLVNKSKRLSPT